MLINPVIAPPNEIATILADGGVPGIIRIMAPIRVGISEMIRDGLCDLTVVLLLSSASSCLYY